MSMAYIRRHYGVPAKRGMRVSANGKPGTITGKRDAYLRIRLDGDKRSAPWHPTWRIQYPGWSRREQLGTRTVVTLIVPGVSC